MNVRNLIISRINEATSCYLRFMWLRSRKCMIHADGHENLRDSVTYVCELNSQKAYISKHVYATELLMRTATLKTISRKKENLLNVLR